MSLEIDYKKLKDLGLTNDGKKKQFCPKCHEKRNNKVDKSLSVDWDRCIAHCHHCDANFFFGKTERIGNYQQPKALSTMKEKTYHKPTKLANETMPDEKVLAWFASRGIPAEVVTQEGITQAARSFPQTNQVEKCIVFPYIVEGELVNRKYRTARKHFMLEAGAELVPWRIDSIRDTMECIITEGEMDALSFIVAGRKDVISVPNGAQKNLTWLDRFIVSSTCPQKLV